MTLYKHRRYDEAIEKYKKAIEIDPDYYVGAYYNLACIYSLKGNESLACEWLKKAIEKGYNNWDQIQKDSDFDKIRNSKCFKKIIMKHKKQSTVGT